MLTVSTVVMGLQVHVMSGSKHTKLYTSNIVCHLHLDKAIFKNLKYKFLSPNELESLGMGHRSLCV